MGVTYSDPHYSGLVVIVVIVVVVVAGVVVVAAEVVVVAEVIVVLAAQTLCHMMYGMVLIDVCRKNYNNPTIFYLFF